MTKKTLAALLEELGALTGEHAKQLEDRCRENSIDFVRCAKEFGVSDEQLARAFSAQFDLPYIAEITQEMVDPQVLRLISLRFLKENSIIPVAHVANFNTGLLVCANPFYLQPLDELRAILPSVQDIAVAPASMIIDALNRLYPLQDAQAVIQDVEEDTSLAAGSIDLSSLDESDIAADGDDAPIIKLVNHVLYQAVKQEASDIHIEPFEKELRVRYRIDGVLYTVMTPPKRAQSAIIARLKIMSNLNIAEKRIPQDGRIQIKVADRPIDVRVSMLPTVYGERVVMRLLDKTKSFRPIEDLGLSDRDYKVLLQAIESPNGIIYVTGPTGSGKTSTLYAILSRLNTPDVNIITVEDPVEYQMTGIGQVQVSEKAGMTFAAALRSILRQDPDIVMIGETRDQETAQIAIQASLTGHLVLSTLHTNSAAASITRLIDMGIEPFLIASSVVVIIAQRLVRRLCSACKQSYVPDQETLRRLGVSKDPVGITFYKAIGCHDCLSTGYSGRLPLFEILVVTGELARLTIERADTARLQDIAVKEGMTLLVADGVRKIEQGLTTVEEVLSVASSAEGIVQDA